MLLPGLDIVVGMQPGGLRGGGADHGYWHVEALGQRIERGRARRLEDALVVNLGRPGGGLFMPLFVKLATCRGLDGWLREEIRSRLRKEYTPGTSPTRSSRCRTFPLP